MMLPHDVAEMLETFARQVERIRGVSRHDMHAFIEDKSDAVGAMRAKAKALRTVPVIPKPLPVLRPGVIEIPSGSNSMRRREVRVEVRGRRRA